MNSFAIRVWGDFALFNQPQFGADPHTYPCITPSAAKGILRSIRWKPEYEWEIDEIIVEKMPHFETLKLKAVTHKREDPHQRGTTLQTITQLRDVQYVIRAHIALNTLRVSSDQMKKYIPELTRWFSREREFRRPTLGRIEYTAEWSNLTPESEVHPVPYNDKFRMLFDLAPVDISRDRWNPIFFDAVIRNGVLQVPQQLYAKHRAHLMKSRMAVHPNIKQEVA